LLLITAGRLESAVDRSDRNIHKLEAKLGESGQPAKTAAESVSVSSVGDKAESLRPSVGPHTLVSTNISRLR
jgi:hypothetical protein